MKVRTYGKRVNEWKSTMEDGRQVTVQIEVKYYEYDVETAELVGTGTEDFSMKRWNDTVQSKWLYTWDGQRRNKGGYRWFEDHGLVRFSKKDRKAIKEYYTNKYNAELVELR